VGGGLGARFPEISGGVWERFVSRLIDSAHFGVPGYLKVSPFVRPAPQRGKCLIVEVGKSLPEGLVAARQQSRREHVETIRTMLAHVPDRARFDIGYRYRRQFPLKRWPSLRFDRSLPKPLFFAPLRGALRRAFGTL
jgi:hypothetical protein